MQRQCSSIIFLFGFARISFQRLDTFPPFLWFGANSVLCFCGLFSNPVWFRDGRKEDRHFAASGLMPASAGHSHSQCPALLLPSTTQISTVAASSAPSSQPWHRLTGTAALQHAQLQQVFHKPPQS